MQKSVFISSTVYDLKDVRDVVEHELKKQNYNVLLSEKGTIPVDSSLHSYEACIQAAGNCDYLIAILDGRFGGEYGADGKSITEAEIDAPSSVRKKTLVFVRRAVWDAKEILKPYLDAGNPFLPSKIVQDARVFQLLDRLRKRTTGNWLFQFDTPSDILRILGVQLGFSFDAGSTSMADDHDKFIARQIFQTSPVADVERAIELVINGHVKTQLLWDLDYELGKTASAELAFLDEGLSSQVTDFLIKWNEFNNRIGEFFTGARKQEGYIHHYPPENDPFERRLAEEKQILIHAGKAAFHAWECLFKDVKRRWPDLAIELLKE